MFESIVTNYAQARRPLFAFGVALSLYSKQKRGVIGEFKSTVLLDEYAQIITRFKRELPQGLTASLNEAVSNASTVGDAIIESPGKVARSAGASSKVAKLPGFKQLAKWLK